MPTLRNVDDMINNYGVKMIVYGPPGVGKTPLLKTAPNPVVMLTEPGMRSLRGFQGPVIEGFTCAQVDDCMQWLQNSAEAKQFDTFCIDSGTQIAENYLVENGKAKSKGGNQQHGMKLYGAMGEYCMDHFRMLFTLQFKHVVILCKEYVQDQGEGNKQTRPWFPGNMLDIQVAHMYDIVARAHKMGQNSMLQTQGTPASVARSRFANTNPVEPFDLTALINKSMSA